MMLPEVLVKIQMGQHVTRAQIKIARNDTELIDLLGGAVTATIKLGLERGKFRMVSNWRRRGRIADGWRPRVATLAKKEKIRIPADFLETSARCVA